MSLFAERWVICDLLARKTSPLPFYLWRWPFILGGKVVFNAPDAFCLLLAVVLLGFLTHRLE